MLLMAYNIYSSGQSVISGFLGIFQQFMVTSTFFVVTPGLKKQLKLISQSSTMSWTNIEGINSEISELSRSRLFLATSPRGAAATTG